MTDGPPQPQVDVAVGPELALEASAVEKRRNSESSILNGGAETSSSKRVKLTDEPALPAEQRASEQALDRQKGVAPIKKEFLVDVSLAQNSALADDDAAEAAGKADAEPSGGRGGKKTKGGQNHARQFGSSRDTIQLCKSRVQVNEFATQACTFGEKCKFTHDLRQYLREGKREDLQTLNGRCPIFLIRKTCPAGWKCRFVGSHSREIEHGDGRRELTLLRNESVQEDDVAFREEQGEDEGQEGIANVVSVGDKITLRKKKFPTEKSDKYLRWLDYGAKSEHKAPSSKQANGEDDEQSALSNGDHRASYREAPLKPSEKRRIYYGPETPVLAPLTTQGNLPFRRLCVSLGAEITWSEMAMGLPLLQGEKQEWALMKAHESELAPPKFMPKSTVLDYDNAKDLKFGVQIAANKPWLALKTTEVLTSLCPHLRAIDMNCGCPIDLVFRQGAGSALLDTHAKLEKILRGMNTVSNEVPITVKIRMGTKDKQPNAEKLCRRLVLGGEEAQELHEGPAGVAAITLHGRSRQQRYTRSADWEYIAACANLVTKLKSERDDVVDTAREVDARELPVTNSPSGPGLPYFIGNGDVLSHVDYTTHMEHAGVDSCMIGRGALIKPWIFEEISTNQYLDKRSSERLGYIEQFVRNGLEYWGSDEIGVGTTRRFLLEWLSFSCRYVPIGILEQLPPKFGDRPPAFRGRDELETLLSSANYKDWIKISEMFLGPAHKDFRFEPKHKSNSYEIDAEG